MFCFSTLADQFPWVARLDIYMWYSSLSFKYLHVSKSTIPQNMPNYSEYFRYSQSCQTILTPIKHILISLLRVPVECGVVDYDLHGLLDTLLQPLWFLVNDPDMIQYNLYHQSNDCIINNNCKLVDKYDFHL